MWCRLFEVAVTGLTTTRFDYRLEDGRESPHNVNPSTAASSAARLVSYKKGVKQCGNRQILM
jgi:hypothetical protein